MFFITSFTLQKLAHCMEIVYLHIRKFNALNNQDINFGGEYRFEYKSESKKIEATKNELYIPNFYNIHKGGGHVSNVTTIIGKNGSGKSSILEFIAYNLTEGRNLQHELILICKDNKGYSLLSTEELSFDTTIITRYKVIKKKQLSEKEPFDQWDLGYDLRGLPNVDLIYFSNVFDGAQSFPLKGIYDISTNHLIFKDYTLAMQQHTIAVTNNNQVQVHLLQDIYRQVRFITNEVSKERIRFRIPDKLEVRINLEYLLKGFGDERQNETYKSFTKAITESFDLNENDDFDPPLKRFIGFIMLNLIGQLMTSPISLFELKYNSEFHLSPEELPVSKLPLAVAADLFLSALKKQLEAAKIQITPSEALVDATRELIEFTIDNKAKLVSGTSSYLNQPFIIINVKDKDLLNGFMNLYLKTFAVNPYLDFVWDKISSGERALLNIYARFYSLSDKAIFGSELKRNLLILIDEGDVYLHPSWQKKFVKYILDYLPVIFATDKHGQQRNLQIIFTTNSPIPASDILNYNTVFIEKVVIQESGEFAYKAIIKDSLNDQKETFAANIHTLLSDSFFVRNGLIGEFASEKINVAIQHLVNRTKLSAEEREQIRLMIHQIGEPLVKNKMMQLYNNTYNLEIHERLDDIEQRLRRGQL